MNTTLDAIESLHAAAVRNCASIHDIAAFGACVEEAWPAILRALRAAEALSERLRFIHDDPAYVAVWAMYAVHGGNYQGPQYHVEHDKLDTALADLSRRGGR